MVQIDRNADRSAQQQIADYFRYEIGLGRQYKVGDTLPSTRALAAETGVSYHTVRQAYRLLEQDGVVAAEAGSGYRVNARISLDSAARLEQGAAIVADAVRSLVALGLDQSEIEYVIEEHLSVMSLHQRNYKVVVVGSYLEFAESIAAAVSRATLVPTEFCVAGDIDKHTDADYMIVPIGLVRDIGFSISSSEVIAVDTFLSVKVLEAVARLLDYESLGLLTKHPDSIGPLTKAIKEGTGFTGQIIASTTQATHGKMVETFVSQVDLLLYTPATRRVVSRHVEKDTPIHSVAETLTEESLTKIRETLPD